MSHVPGPGGVGLSRRKGRSISIARFFVAAVLAALAPAALGQSVFNWIGPAGGDWGTDGLGYSFPLTGYICTTRPPDHKRPPWRTAVTARLPASSGI